MKQKSALIGSTVALLFALTIYWVFRRNWWQELFAVMTLSFLLCMPFGMGFLTIYFRGERNAAGKRDAILIPWLPLSAFVILTLFWQLEGWACWVMILPLFMAASSLGGLAGRSFLHKLKDKDSKLSVSFIVLLPLILAPIEALIGKIPGTYKADTHIDIAAPAAAIWPLVTRVSTISEQDDTGWLNKSLGFPRPVKAELNYEGVGAYREAIFTGGLIFHETVSEYNHESKMVFSIKANPHEIPSTTMDEHVVIGGDYFDVLNGTYELEKLSQNRYRLHLYSHFQLNTTFNFYASWWAKWIMQDIQNNILGVIKSRAEKTESI
ncbi:hypothetical protein [Dyadobacter sp. Leaf189]|uniref:hypothetical protein n=1 Tax=Dyadobacter sp. Leaf189 TaxID=1736295 RepID=UPI0006F686F9|nr:hypothetical protein [Dyadobacter sp. Leaf189]KQS28344.1 hypothetical protein ASG33_15125 [Dyadobacter sp. Leaf189]